MSSRGGVPECAGAGRYAAPSGSGGRTTVCTACGRRVPINWNGRLRWHTPNPKRKDSQ